MNEPLVRVRDLRKEFPVKGGILRRTVATVNAVAGVDLEIAPGETLGLVGESGCGKTTLGRMMVRLLEPTSGTIEFDGKDVTHLKGEELRRFHQDVQIVFQDPFGSLDPRTPVGNSISEGLRIHGIGDRSERRQRVREMLELVGLRPQHADRYPHEFSGGQRQRIGIARALAADPHILVADEITTALDVSVQAEVLALLDQLREKRHLSCIFISHDLAVVKGIAHRIVVMKDGYVVESGPAEAVLGNPRHSYTQTLLASVVEPGSSTLPSVDIDQRVRPIDPNRPLLDLGDGHLVRQEVDAET